MKIGVWFDGRALVFALSTLVYVWFQKILRKEKNNNNKKNDFLIFCGLMK